MKRPIVILMLLQFLLSAAFAAPDKVYVFNDDRDQANQFAKNYIWQDLGLLEPDGKPGTIQPNGDITNSQNQKIGSVIKDGQGRVIGYRSLDGTKEAYDVNRTTTNMAWMAVAPNGCFVVMKHGGGRNGTQGGGVHLDGGRTFDGVRPQGQQGGTGAGFQNNKPPKNPSGGYELTPRPGANIKVTLYVCNGGTDPDGPGGPKKSVGQSFGGVPGVGTVEDFPRKLAGYIDWEFTKGTPQQRAAALRKLKKEAKERGFMPPNSTKVEDANVSAFINSLPAGTAYAFLNDLIRNTGACVGLRYRTDPPVDFGIDPPIYEPVAQYDAGMAFVYTFDPQISMLTAKVIAEPGDLVEVETFQLDIFEPPKPAPFGRFCSGIFDFRDAGVTNMTTGLLTYELEFIGNPGRITPMFYDFVADDWTPIPPSFVGPTIRFDIPGQRMVSVVENVQPVLIENGVGVLGSVLDYGVWSPEDSADLDLTIKTGGPQQSRTTYTSLFQLDCRATAIPERRLDIRCVARVDQVTANLTVEILDRNQNQYVTVGTANLTTSDRFIQIFGVDATNFLDGEGRFSMRLRSTRTGPLLFPGITTTYSHFEVVGY
ncbi:MAG: hypothetical protein KIT11_01205 [Fimbriimonadaceae bacterium]|nr:hypothetical protein [Fimbriimonadaceae bacterium]QYK55008.1 MAG: hypothetical protein KF733_08330 [Fimbriimonadaceae bacterium]